ENNEQLGGDGAAVTSHNQTNEKRFMFSESECKIILYCLFRQLKWLYEK
ncbi:MAG: hypothetical protein JWQ14_1427, partial [Adhaeribacter sp.]|nr:hypothetical protein [Adhaeribacter sp.]